MQAVISKAPLFYGRHFWGFFPVVTLFVLGAEAVGAAMMRPPTAACMPAAHVVTDRQTNKQTNKRTLPSLNAVLLLQALN